MPLLIHAVPLTSTWTGVHYWKTSRPEDLPLELEYLSYQEFEDRFNQLNKIAKPTFPSVWPNFGIALLLLGLIPAAVIGISRSGTNVSILGQGACFLLPILVIIWIKIRSGIEARARRKFKIRSQKLLRAWTTEDAELYAIQWKLRQRPANVASRWLGDYRSSQQDSQTSPTSNVTQERGQHDDQNAGTGLNHVQTDQTHESGSTSSVIHTEPQSSQQSSDHSAINQHQQESTSTSSLSSIPIITEPSPVASTNQTIRFSSQVRRSVTNDSITGTISLAEGVATEQTNGTTEVLLDGAASLDSPTNNTEPAMTSMSASTAGEHRQHMSFYSYLMECIRGPSHISRVLQERRVWLIEISVRDCQLDDYALTVPSPVYCGYRLPGYEDAMATGSGSGSLAGIAARLGASTSRLGLNRYFGEPPAYESDTDEDSDDEAEDDDNEDSDHNQDTERVNTGSDIVACPPSGSQQAPEMTMIQRPEVSSVVVLSSARQAADTSITIPTSGSSYSRT
ncbi:hypothetical protein BGX26_010162 [Mortierella sp. AD094]|nr:hypothetical protein BGX26_010162 [Mortierella sp. AD094]